MSEPVKRYQGRFLGISERDRWEYAYRTNARAVVVIAAVTDDDKLLLVEQYRIPVQASVMELPAGLAGDLEDPDEPLLLAAQRELEEETGFSARHWSKLLTCPSSAGMSDEILTIYLARGLNRTGPGGGDGNEDIIVHEVPLDRVPVWMDQRRAEGFMVDPKVYAALFWLANGAPAAIEEK
jgi:ADP-ribose pyrophosphatase